MRSGKIIITILRLWHKVVGKLTLTRDKKEGPLVIIRKATKDRYLINASAEKGVPNEWLIEGKAKVEQSNGQATWFPLPSRYSFT